MSHEFLYEIKVLSSLTSSPRGPSAASRKTGGVSEEEAPVNPLGSIQKQSDWLSVLLKHYHVKRSLQNIGIFFPPLVLKTLYCTTCQVALLFIKSFTVQRTRLTLSSYYWWSISTVNLSPQSTENKLLTVPVRGYLG